MPSIEWTREQSAQAQQEGWDIFHVDRSPTHQYEIERIDVPEDGSPPVFDGDAEAWEHIVVRAAAGSVLHSHALQFIKTNSPDEWREMGAPAP